MGTGWGGVKEGVALVLMCEKKKMKNLKTLKEIRNTKHESSKLERLFTNLL